MKWKAWLVIITIPLSFTIQAQDAAALLQAVKAKLEKVNDYTATGKLKTDVAFLKVPVAKVFVYFKKPDRFRISKEKGVSILPKGGVNINMQNVLAGNDYIAIDAGTTTINGTLLRVVKVLPGNDASDIVLTTFFIDEKLTLIKKVAATTKENGSYEIVFSYGKWSNYALPDKTVFSFNTKEYKLPKGVTLEFDDGERADPQKLQNKKGTIEIIYDSYEINKGVPDHIFAKG